MGVARQRADEDEGERLEMGHALGIDAHSPFSGDIMSIDDSTTDVSKSDVDTLRVAYGGAFPH